MLDDAIPSFFLYGEPPRAVGDRFLHLEAIDDRTRPSNWNIRPHAHANLNHVFHIASGGGELRADDQVIAFAAPCLLLIPAGAVHGLAYETESAGSVLTLSEAYLRDLVRREAAFARLFATPARVPLANPERVAQELNRLGVELSWRAPGHAAAVEALLIGLLVEALRQAQHARGEPSPTLGAPAGLVARFRELVEARYRSGDGVEAYAAALSVSPKRLRAACVRAAGVPPLQILQDRVVLEAKRLMLYSNMTVAEVGYYLGFADPAYFSRFFAKACGAPPRAFRAQGERIG